MGNVVIWRECWFLLRFYIKSYVRLIVLKFELLNMVNVEYILVLVILGEESGV